MLMFFNVILVLSAKQRFIFTRMPSILSCLISIFVRVSNACVVRLSLDGVRPPHIRCQGGSGLSMLVRNLGRKVLNTNSKEKEKRKEIDGWALRKSLLRRGR